MSDKIQITVKAELYIEDGETLVDQLLLGKLHDSRSCNVELMEWDSLSEEDKQAIQRKIDAFDSVISDFTVR